MEVHRLESELTPRAFRRRIDGEGARRGAPLAEALRSSPTARFLETADRLEPFRRRVLAPGATLYTGGPLVPGRSLLVAFCGKADRLMLPLPVFLQHLPAASWDVLLLKDAWRTHYRRGCNGFAGSFVDLVGRVAAIGAGYRRRAAIGVSMGGLPAVRFALLASAERGISIGGRPPEDALRLRDPRVAADAFDPLCACLPDTARDLVFAHSAGCGDDAAAARRFARVTGGRQLPVAGQASHNLMQGLLGCGRLGDFLDLILNGPMSALAALDPTRLKGPDPTGGPAWRP